MTFNGPSSANGKAYSAVLLAVARKIARREDSAKDLLQGAMLVAVEKGRADMMLLQNRRWLCGVMRNLAAFEARSAARRKIRETHWVDLQGNLLAPICHDEKEARFFALGLPPRLRTAALLALSGHTRPEIAHLLRVSDMAVRQYVSDIRRRWHEQGGETEVDMFGLSGALAYGRIRQRLRIHLARVPKAVLASHDPDGHVFSVTMNSQNDR